MADPTTKERILDSAELLFAQQGIAATSLRALTDHAGVNLASVNYYFHSKDALIQAVLFRRLQPVNQRRLAMLADARARNLGPVPVEEILDAFYRPAVEAASPARGGSPEAGALLGRVVTEPDELLAGQVRAHMAEVFTAFQEALAAALPALSLGPLFWRLQFTAGLATHTLGAAALLEGLNRGRVRLDDPEETIRQLIAFAAAGLRAAP